jgi:hypothetical protein
VASTELNSFKLFFFSNLVVVMGLLVLLILTPSSTGAEVLAIGALSIKMSLGVAYFLFFLACLAMIMFDLVLKENETPIDTITVDESPRFPLQRLLGFEGAAAASVVLGLLMAWWYYSSIAVEKKMFIFVPSFFAVSPLASTLGVSAKVYDVVMSAVTVSFIEELLFAGIFFVFIWRVLDYAVSVFGFDAQRLEVNVTTLFAAAIILGLTASLAFHSFAPNYNAYSFEDCARHFTMTSLIAGSTGNIYGGIIAHAIHNYAAKTFVSQGSYQVLYEFFPT